MTNSEVMNAFGAFDLDSQVYGNLSLAARLAAGVKDRANSFRFSMWLNSFDRKTTTFLETMHAMIEGRKKVPAPAKDAEPATPERLRATADNLEHMARIIDYIYESGRRAQL